MEFYIGIRNFCFSFEFFLTNISMHDVKQNFTVCFLNLDSGFWFKMHNLLVRSFKNLTPQIVKKFSNNFLCKMDKDSSLIFYEFLLISFSNGKFMLHQAKIYFEKRVATEWIGLWIYNIEISG